MHIKTLKTALTAMVAVCTTGLHRLGFTDPAESLKAPSGHRVMTPLGFDFGHTLVANSSSFTSTPGGGHHFLQEGWGGVGKTRRTRFTIKHLASACIDSAKRRLLTFVHRSFGSASFAAPIKC